MATIGYGDVIPRTILGQQFWMCACIAGIFLYSMTFVAMRLIVDLNSYEEKVYLELLKKDSRKEI